MARPYPCTVMNQISLEAAKRVRGGDLPHVPPKAVPLNTPIHLELDAPADATPVCKITDVHRQLDWEIAMTRAGDTWRAEMLTPSRPTVLRYHFILADGTHIQERRQLEGVTKPLFGEWETCDFRLAVYDPAGVPPTWVQGQAMYQIFPDRFAIGDSENLRRKHELVHEQEPVYQTWGIKPEHPPQGRDFYGGDLRGVINKLDYIEALGITCVYFTPIFESPSNHRYDAVDYFKIDTRLGTEADLRELIAAANQRGIRVLLDGVFNHCSNKHPFFLAAREDQTSPYTRWFEFEAWPQYKGWLGVQNMPEFIECPEVEEYFLGEDGVVRHWLRMGTAGWRTDVTPWMTDEFCRRIGAAIKDENPEAYYIAEDWGDCTARFLGDQYHATMNYRFAYTVVGFANGNLSPSELDDRLETIRRDYAEPFFNAQMNLLGSHDTPRLLSQCNGDKQRVMLAAALQLGYTGVAMVFAGDEAGSEGTYAEAARVPFPWDSMDEELHTFYRRALNARKNSQALRLGTLETVWIDDANCTYGFVREYAASGERVYVLLNEGDAPATITLPASAGTWRDLLARLPEINHSGAVLSITLPAKTAAWYSMSERER